ncbi:homeodomain-like protein [Tanacetum coccineum]
MTRSSTNELFTPLKDSEREFPSSRKHFKTLILDELRILDSRGAIPSKTAADVKVSIQEMTEYSQKWHNGTSRSRSTETSNRLAAIQAQLNNLGRDIQKVNETTFSRRGYKHQLRRLYKRNNANPSYQERRQSMEDTLSKFISESAKRHEENSNLIKEIRASTDAAIQNQGASIKTLEIQIGKMSKSISTTIEVDSCPIRRIGSSQYAVSTEQNPYSEASHINNSIPRKEKDPGSFTLPCFINNVCFDNALVNLGASVSIMPLSTYINLGLGKLAHTKLIVELADMTVKYPKRIAESVLVGIGALMNVLIFVGTFSVVTDFAVLENMDAYRDEIMGNVIFGEPFLREVRIKTRRFEGMITIYNGNDEVTYQMVRSHPRFKHHTNEQCNKIPPLLKVSDEDKKNGISHPYQKLKGFYKGVLNLGPDYIRDAKMEELAITRAH